MLKEFNTTGICVPEKHYMVDISDRLAEIKRMVDAGKYFCINRARQYGKTTTLAALADCLAPEYNVVSLDFQALDMDAFKTGGNFTQGIARILLDSAEFANADIPKNILDTLEIINNKETEKVRMDELFRVFKRWCRESDEKMVLMIDEVDSAANNQVFLDFLAQLRLQFLEKEKNAAYPAFSSVILAGVTDVRHLKAKIRPESEHKENSPWNIAAEFNVDMSLPETGIRGMLEEYEADHQTGMNTAEMAKLLRAFTNGYPYLVSRLCQLMDGAVAKKTGLSQAWTEEGLDEAIKILLADGNDTLFGSLMSKLANMPKLKAQLRDVLMKGEPIPWQPYEENQALLSMYGFIRNRNNTVAVDNRIFEMLLYHHFLSESRKNEALLTAAQVNKPLFIEDDGTLNMPLILEHFVETERRVHGDADEKFLEDEGRERFLTYIAPIINGTGTYSVEEQTRDRLRMDVVIHYLGRRYVVELKIWRGPRYNEAGEKQIMEYLDYFGLNTGYMVSFCFNKNKEPGVKRVQIGDRVLYEATV